MINLKKRKDYLISNLKKIFDSKNQIIIFIFLGLIIIGHKILDSRNKTTATFNTNAKIDVKIPKGFVLVPIKVINYSSIIEIIGDYGRVDIYENSNQKKKILSGIKIIRTHDSEFGFMALIKETRAHFISPQLSYFFVVRNPNQNLEPTTNGVQIVYSSEGRI